MAKMRVQKILAQAGIASRRKAEELIQEGVVTINGKTAKLGDQADLDTDAIKVRGKLLRSVEAPVYVAFHKPKGVISMMDDPQNRPTLAGYMSRIRTRVFPVGRLDFNSEGLILLTNDGTLAEKIQKSDQIPRIYQVKIKGHPHPDALGRVEKGARVEDRLIKPFRVRLAKRLTAKSFVEVVFMGGGATTDVKALFEARGLLVERVVRTGIGHLSLHGLAAGEMKLLKKSQVEALLTQPELALRILDELAEDSPPAEDRETIREREREAKRPKIAVKPTITPNSDRRERGDRSDRGDRGDRKPQRPRGRTSGVKKRSIPAAR